MFREGIVQSKYVGYYLHPEISRLAVSPTGKIIDLEQDACLLPIIGFFPYPVVKVPGCDYTVHRIVAETFLVNPDPDKYYQVNHKNGDKTDPCITNLEWSNHSENIIHAYKTGLRSDNLVLEVKNLLTGETMEYYSLNELDRNFEVNPGAISIYLSSKRDAPYEDIYSIIRKGEEHTLTKADTYKHRNGLSREIIIQKLSDGKYYIYSSVGDASADLGIKAHLFYSYLNNGIKNIEKHGVRAWYLSQHEFFVEDAIRMPKRPVTRGSPTRTPVPIVVYDKMDKSTRVYPSSKFFADAVGVCKSVIQKATKHNNGNWRQYRIKYKR